MISPRLLNVSQPQSRRREIILELLSTERNYVSCLNAFFSTYVWHLSTQKFVPMPTQYLQLMQNLEVIKQLHSQFYDELLSHISIESWESDSEVSPLFKKFSPFFRIYGDVIHQVEAVGNLVQDLALEHPALEDLLQYCRQDPRCNKHTFQSFLIMPAQRIPRYILLLKNLLLHTPLDHVEKRSLQEVTELLDSILQQINQEALNECNRKILAKMHKKMPKSFNVFLPRRKFIMKTKMQLMLQDQSVMILDHSIQPVKLVLFNDTLLIVKNFIGHYRIVKKFDFSYCSSLTVKDGDDFPATCKGTDENTGLNRIVLSEENGQRYILQCANYAMKRKWLDMIHQCIKACALNNSNNRRESDRRASYTL